MNLEQQKEILLSLNACTYARLWVDSAGDEAAQEKWNTCMRPDWLLWLAGKLQVDARTIDIINIRTLMVLYGLIESNLDVNQKVLTLRLLKNINAALEAGVSSNDISYKYGMETFRLIPRRHAPLLESFYQYLHDVASSSGNYIYHHLARSLLSLNVFHGVHGREAALNEQLCIIRKYIPWRTIQHKLKLRGLA